MYNRKQGRSLSVEDWFKIINFQKGHVAIEYSIQDTVTSSGETNIDGPFAHSNRASELLAAVQTQRVKQMRILHCQNTFGSHGFQPPEPILWDKFNLHLLPACSRYLVQKPLSGSHGLFSLPPSLAHARFLAEMLRAPPSFIQSLILERITDSSPSPQNLF